MKKQKQKKNENLNSLLFSQLVVARVQSQPVTRKQDDKKIRKTEQNKRTKIIIITITISNLNTMWNVGKMVGNCGAQLIAQRHNICSVRSSLYNVRLLLLLFTSSLSAQRNNSCAQFAKNRILSSAELCTQRRNKNKKKMEMRKVSMNLEKKKRKESNEPSSQDVAESAFIRPHSFLPVACRICAILFAALRT